MHKERKNMQAQLSPAGYNTYGHAPLFECGRMCEFAHVFEHVCVRAHVLRACERVCVCTCAVCMCLYTRVCARLCLCVHVCICVACVPARVCAHAYKHTCQFESMLEC